jgi:MoxR-like ATPase
MKLAEQGARYSESGSNHLNGIRAGIQIFRDKLNLALRGKSCLIEKVLACLFAQGHLLLEDLPGLGKTTLAKAISAQIGGKFSRLQCTPDLLPGDITGFSVFNQKSREFEFVQGPVFTDVLLADEINRTSPRTQSALLEAMAERQVSVDNERRILPETFFVIATQNPIEHQGTYALPEAQLDRFAMKLSVGYPEPEEELKMLIGAVLGGTIESSNKPSMSLDDLTKIQHYVSKLRVSSAVGKYLVGIAGETRNHPALNLGISPRGLLILQRVSQAWAFLKGRDFVIPDDVQDVALPVLAVRLGVISGKVEEIVSDILSRVRVPIS